jgi:hypothetical protein
MGPSTIPCGTPDSTVASFENSPSRAMRIFSFVKNVVSHVEGLRCRNCSAYVQCISQMSLKIC